MSDNTVEITEISNYTITIDTSLVQNDNNITIETSSPNTVDIINNTTILVSDLPQGYPLDWTTGNLSISRVSGLSIVGTSGVNVTSNSGIYTVFLNDPIINSNDIVDFLESVQDIIGNSGLIAGNYIDINYNDSSGLTTILATGLQPSGNYSVVGHTHYTTDITNFDTSVSGLLPVKNIIAGSGIGINSVNGDFTVSVTGTFGLTGEEVDDRINNLLIAGPYINLNYNDNLDNLTISVTGLQPSGDYSLVGHSHIISDISGLQLALDNKQPSGIYASGIHNHTSADISDFSSSVSGLLPSVTGIGYVVSNFQNNIYEISVIGLQPSGDYSLIGHTHVISDVSGLQVALDNKQPSGIYASGVHYHLSSDITDFGNAVSGLIPPSNFSSLTGVSGISVTNSGTNYFIGLSDSSIELNDITDLSNNAITFLSNPSSNNLQTLVLDETGSGLLVFNTSPSFSGIPTVPTAPTGTNNNQIASTSFVRSEISNLVDSAPGTLDTLNELAAALADDPNFATTIASGLANKAPLVHNHISSDITNFNSSVSGLLPNIVGSGYVNSVFINNTYTISTSGLQPSGNYSIVGHSHITTDITDFNSGVSGLLPVTNILGGTNISVTPSGTVYTVSVSGQLGLTAEEVDDRVSNLLVAGTGIGLDYNDSLNSLTIYTSGLQPSGDYSLVGHSHNSSDITDFDSAVSGLLPSVVGTGYIYSSFTNNIYTISASGLQPSGNYSLVGHTHSSSDITDFNSSVSGLIPVKNIVSGVNISVTNVSGIYTINSTVNSVAESASLITTIFNKTGSPIPKMTAVYINGGQGDQPTVGLAIATGDATSANTYGITFESIPNMSTGKVVVFGALSGVNTDQFNPTAPVGDVNGRILYLSPSISGGLTLTKPHAPDHIVALGTIVRTHQNDGVIEVRVQNGFELEELHNVAVTGVTNGQFLQYNSGSGLWVPSSSGNFTSLSVNGTGVSLVGHSHVANIGDGISGVISYNLNDNLNIIGSGSTTVEYNNISKTINISSPSLIREYELINSSKSTFTVTGGYAVNNLDVYHNGIKLLASGDYTAINGSTFDLLQPAVSGDVVEWLGYSVVPRHQLILGEVRSDTSGNINYLGRAVAGSSEASGVWTIKRYTISDNGIDISAATASNAIWNNRLTETYV